MKIIAFMALCFVTTVGKAQNKISVQIENLKNEKGVCRACLFDNAKAFSSEGNKAVICKFVKISYTRAILIFDSVPVGTYAISVFHDENNNNKLDKNFIGIPKEGYGASKNALPRMSRPSFDENAFRINNQPVNLVIKIRYL